MKTIHNLIFKIQSLVSNSLTINKSRWSSVSSHCYQAPPWCPASSEHRTARHTESHHALHDHVVSLCRLTCHSDICKRTMIIHSFSFIEIRFIQRERWPHLIFFFQCEGNSQDWRLPTQNQKKRACLVSAIMTVGVSGGDFLSVGCPIPMDTIICGINLCRCRRVMCNSGPQSSNPEFLK